MAGQPKNTSEYIQATSRVGRSVDGPGLVCTVYNWSRPRDLSHYERFEHYHETFYKHVEALSVTPFSARALDRGLSGVMVALMRLAEERLNGNIKAGSFPGLRLVLLHSLSHALMRQIVLDCGYTAASVRERLYSRQPGEDGGPMAGILLYTAAPDSEGTLGGLVELGDPMTLGRHLEQALESMRLCASDPLCSEHRPDTLGRSSLAKVACAV